MKILYCSYSQIPSGFANSIAVMKQCGALKNFADIRVILIKGSNATAKEVFSMYGVNDFKLLLLPKWTLLFQELGLKLFVLIYGMLYRPDMVYSRDILLNDWLCFFNIRNIYEMHQLDQENEKFDALFKKILKRIKEKKKLTKIVCISETLAKECMLFGVPEDLLCVLHSGVDLNEFNHVGEIELPFFSNDRPLAIYVGSLQKGKGIDLIIRMAEIASYFNFLVVGGEQGKITETKNLRHIPRVSHEKALAYMKRADFLLLPMTEQKYKFHSPLKLFEYLASGKTIIASDNPDMREIIIHTENGMLADEEDPNDFIKMMDEVRCSKDLQRRIEEGAKRTAAKYTWENRAKKIIGLARM